MGTLSKESRAQERAAGGSRGQLRGSRLEPTRPVCAGQVRREVVLVHAQRFAVLGERLSSCCSCERSRSIHTQNLGPPRWRESQPVDARRTFIDPRRFSECRMVQRTAIPYSFFAQGVRLRMVCFSREQVCSLGFPFSPLWGTAPDSASSISALT